LPSRKLDVVALAAHARLSAFKLPTVWLVTADPSEVPMLATSKLDKPALQQLLRLRAQRVRAATRV